jgi:hypothetical protein
MYFDLDEPISYAQDADNGDGYFKDHVVTLAPGEVQTFSFQMTVATPDGPVTEDINDNGKPFELTAIADEEDNSTFAFPGYSYVYDGPNPNDEFVRVNPKTGNRI